MKTTTMKNERRVLSADVGAHREMAEMTTLLNQNRWEYSIMRVKMDAFLSVSQEYYRIDMKGEDGETIIIDNAVLPSSTADNPLSLLHKNVLSAGISASTAIAIIRGEMTPSEAGPAVKAAPTGTQNE